MTNDPRFAEDSLLDKRLAAFGSLGVISGLMVATAMDQVYEMKKDIHLFQDIAMMDVIKFTAYLLISFVLYANIMAMYVGVAQTYHSIRLSTAGPTGFENAKIYYMNNNIVFYRHVSIRLMLNSLWVFMCASGLRMWTKFSEDVVSGAEWAQETPEAPTSAPLGQPVISGLTVLGGLNCLFFLGLGASIFYLHVKHVKVFRERYDYLHNQAAPLLSTMATYSTRRNGSPDV